MADAPQGPGGGGQGGGNPNLNQWADVAKAVTSVERSTALIEQHMNTIAKKGDETSKIFKTAGTDLKVMVALSENVEEAIKGMREQSKKFQQTVMKSKTWEDQRKALIAMAQGFKQMQKEFGSIPKMARTATRGFDDCVRALTDMKGKTGEMGEELIGAQKTLKSLTSDFDHLAKTVKGIELGHMTRQMVGISKALQTAGITKGKTAAYAEQGAALAAKMREMKKARLDENKADYMARRRDALSSVEAKYGRNTADPARAEALRRSMGVSWFKRKSFAAAEAGGAGAQEAFGQHMPTGLGGMGMMSRAAGMVESGIGGAGTLISKAAPILAVLDVLRMAFDKTVEQNKDMEAGLGKGGLFTAAPGSAGFMQARQALTPQGFGFTKMGLSFERNLKMAQAVVEGGYNIAELVTGDRGKGRAGGDYMPGALGQFQQIAVGAGRVAGFGDAEGIQQTMKLLNQYRMTLETSQDFFIGVAKDAKAAGLSTAKYIEILDSINGHFDRMNKSMSQAVNVLGALSRSGAVAGDSLQTIMDFFTQNPKTTFDSVAPKTFTYSQMTPGMRKAIEQGHTAALTASIESANTALSDIPGMQSLVGAGDLSKKGMAGANAYLTQIQSQIESSGANATSKKAAREAVQAVRDQMQRNLGQRGGALGYATGESTFGSDLVNTMGDNISQMISAGNIGAGGLRNMMTGQMGANQRLALEGILQKVYGQGDFTKNLNAFQQSQRLAATDRVRTAMGNPEDAKSLVAELMKLQGFRAMFRTKKYPMDQAMNAEQSVEFLKDNQHQLGEMVSYLGTTAEYQVKQAGLSNKVTEGDRRQAEYMGKVIGMQTQSTADIIANAFSTWFNDIISLLGKLTSWFVKPNPKDAAAAKAIFEDQHLQDAANAKQNEIAKQMDSLTAQMASGKLSPDEFKQAEKEYKTAQATLAEIQKYTNDDARKTASLGEAQQYKRDVLGDPAARAMKAQQDLWGKITSVKGVSSEGAGMPMFAGPSALAKLHAMPDIQAALKSGALKEADMGAGKVITINNYYSADYDYTGTASDGAGTAGSSGEASTNGKNPKQ